MAGIRLQSGQAVATWSGLPFGARTPLAGDEPGLSRRPEVLDPSTRSRTLQVTRLDADDPFAAVARHQGAPAAYRLADRGAGLLLLAVRVGDTVHERTLRDFADDCGTSRVADPAELWDRDDLPRWLRRQLRTADQERHPTSG